MRTKTNKTRALEKTAELERVAKRYAVSLTPHIAENLDKDTIARQYIPQLEELAISPGEMRDPIGDDAHSPVKGIVHRYPDRVLYKIASTCAAYCRYCFRREMIGPKNADTLKKTDHENALDYIRAHKEIWEVILTGGDPLVLSAEKLGRALDDIEAMPHIQVLRIHTRFPMARPEEITDELCKALTRDKALYIALHINHADELTPEVITAIKKLQKTGAVLLSQSVLLKDINDNAEALENLFRSLVALKIKPYYLHHADLAPGTSHFRTTIKHGQKLVRALQGKISGLCQPAYMLDIPGGHGKIPLAPSYTEDLENGTYRLQDRKGQKHEYQDS